jgi:hypothetical protein
MSANSFLPKSLKNRFFFFETRIIYFTIGSNKYHLTNVLYTQVTKMRNKVLYYKWQYICSNFQLGHRKYILVKLALPAGPSS